ncbi:NAD-dependent dehydratase [Flavobacterium rivuli WB 3.3-2 = DSM 21788]|uniref:NAD-dependent dehydratase n=1 Tax=Flavobacterium rivuli WB 3.3-2 = DSM 21788 TaxID=1121895 RepID=A0A0A2M275_9FLAO|nr:NAD(P)H-binding protein [Flavobacterium rivuli]KGO86379.1 NAD-dependent dehydratase [Flavobacterium rivuli WB 3.3-2 = DSM 21788]
MKITIAGSLGNIGRPLTQNLVKAGHDVTVISSSPAREADINALGAKAAIGYVNDSAFLNDAFTGAHAVFTMTPPNMGGSNIIKNTTLAGEAFAQAIKQSGVQRVVMLSSIGGDLPTGNGPIAGLYNIEQLFNQLNGVAITYLRAGYFYTNFYNDIPLIEGMDIMGGNFPDTAVLPLVHPNDIAEAAAEELQKAASGNYIRYIVSDVVQAGAVAKALGVAINKPELPWVEFTDEQSLQGMLQAGLPEEIAGLYTEMGTGLSNGSVASHFLKTNAPVTGKIKLEEFAKEFAAKF